MRMIEKVARALCRADGKDPDAIYTLGTCGGGFSVPNWEFHYPFMAIRAMEAMREPTKEMCEAAVWLAADDNLRAMIDTALAEVKNEND